MQIFRATVRADRRQTTAFSLVEMLVAIGILALLIGILLPVIGRATDSARRTQCQSNLRQLQFAWMTYAAQHNGDLVGSDTSDPGDWLRMNVNSVTAIQQGLLYPYAPTPAVYHCPSDTSDHYDSFSINFTLNGSYTYYNDKTIPIRVNTEDIVRPSATICFVEEDDHRGNNQNSFVIKNSGSNWVDFPANFHHNGCSIGFCDGHVEFWQFLDPTTAQIRAANASTPGSADLARFQAGAGY